MVFDVVVFYGNQCEKQHSSWKDDDAAEPKERPSKKIKSEEQEVTVTLPTTKEKMEVPSNHEASGHPHFLWVIKPYSVNWGHLQIPSQFARSNGWINRTCIITVKDPQEKSWCLGLKTSGNKVRLGRRSTLTELLTENGLKEGDTVKFELVENGKTPVVNILPCFTVVEPEETKDSPGHCPSFTSTIKPYSLSEIANLNLPLEFARSNELIEKDEMILMDERQRTWPVRLKLRTTHFSITAGWKDFREANEIKEGDAYKFELIEKGNRRTKPVARFTIVPHSTPRSSGMVENIAMLDPTSKDDTKSIKDHVIPMAESPVAPKSITYSEKSFVDLLSRIEASRSSNIWKLDSSIKSNCGATMSFDSALNQASEILSWCPTEIFGTNSNKVESIVETLLNNSPNNDTKKALAAFQQHFAQNCKADMVYKPKVDDYLDLMEQIGTVDRKVEGLGNELKKLNEDFHNVTRRKAELELELEELHTREKELKRRSLSTGKAAEEALTELESLQSSHASKKEEFDLLSPVVAMADSACNNLKDALQQFLSSRSISLGDGSRV
ncbi:OLC1v1018574C1 [Oldenlandia corymbosa var. corymbosa]|uniref:OLC1v1018574C1 n=1 Tax=Oldenlandia corymbosa var. corymbosa TaxID=529605 RepID=A0AAV1EC13_OLDCO|nr:OLC1v1018574C1 [Oldenlandia corymbosa var. corymbosa]